MVRSYQALGVFVVAAFGLWGCTRGPVDSGSSGTTDKLKTLEARAARLEDDFKSMTASRDQLRKKIDAAETDKERLQQEIERLKGVVRERDELKVTLAARTVEHDTYQTQYEGFRKTLKDLIGQAEVALVAPAAPPTSGPTLSPAVSAEPGARASSRPPASSCGKSQVPSSNSSSELGTWNYFSM